MAKAVRRRHQQVQRQPPVRSMPLSTLGEWRRSVWQMKLEVSKLLGTSMNEAGPCIETASQAGRQRNPLASASLTRPW